MTNPELLGDISALIARHGANNESLAMIITHYIILRDCGAESYVRDGMAWRPDDVFTSPDAFDLVVS